MNSLCSEPRRGFGTEQDNTTNMAENEFEMLVALLRDATQESAIAMLEHTTINTSRVLPNGCSLLRIAALRGHLKCVQLLLENPEAKPGDALQDAAANGHVLCLEEILKDSRTNPNHYRVWTPLFMATFKGHAACVKALLSHPDIDPNKGRRQDKESPLNEAVRRLKVDCVAMLLAHPRINPNTACSDGKSPLHEACTPKYDDDDDARAKRRTILSLLLSHAVIDVNTRTAMPYVLPDYTPLCLAVNWKYRDAVELLLRDERVSLDAARKDVLRDIDFFGETAGAGSRIMLEAIQAEQRRRDRWQRRRSWILECLVLS